jgi:hypothetical protein
MNDEISLVITSLMFTLFLSTVLATTITTDYAGNGDLYLETTIHSIVKPDITDSGEIHTGCEGGCCCCPDCYGEYEGTQVVTNDPFSASGHQTTVVDGCVVIEQKYDDEFNSYKTETSYYTYFNGTGTAESYVYAVPGIGMSYQLSNGTGSTYASFSQIVYLDDTFDYAILYGGGTWLCTPGYVGLFNAYDFYTNPGYYNPELGLYCVPIDETSNVYAFLHTKTTDSMDLDAYIKSGWIEWYQDIEVEGSSQYDVIVTSSNDLDFDFETVLG